MSKKLWAMPHDNSFDGDNIFCCPNSEVPYKDGMTLKDIREAYYQHISKQEKNNPFYDDKEFRDEANEIKGAWILDGKGIKICQAVWPSDGCGHDGAVYACNSAAKRIAAEVCIKEIKK